MRSGDRAGKELELWHRGDLSHLLHKTQEQLRDAYLRSTSRRYVICCARQLGKSYLACTLGCEQCLQLPGSQVRYAAPTAKMVQKIIEPLMFRKILAECPPELKPRYWRQEGLWSWPNGSEFHVAGTDKGGAERLRGTGTHLGIIDEAGIIDDLDYLVSDILMPQTITTNGRILELSSPPRTPAHPFQRHCQEAEEAGAYQHRTIYDAPHISDAQREEYMEESGGPDTSTWRREYRAQFVVDEESAVIPEFSRHEADVVGELELPNYRNAIVAMDVGYTDLTAALLGYYHWDAAKVVVEDEAVLQHATSGPINDAVKAREAERWGTKKPQTRVVDAPQIVVADLNALHPGQPWREARKDDKDAQINALRLAIARHDVLIHPRCKVLISHLRHAVWNKARTSYERSGDHGHFDAVDAMVYLLRHVDRHSCPIPDLLPHQRPDTHWTIGRTGRVVTEATRTLEGALSGGRSRRR
jgi:hypothetical protein